MAFLDRLRPPARIVEWNTIRPRALYPLMTDAPAPLYRTLSRPIEVDEIYDPEASEKTESTEPISSDASVD